MILRVRYQDIRRGYEPIDETIEINGIKENNLIKEAINKVMSVFPDYDESKMLEILFFLLVYKRYTKSNSDSVILLEIIE
jgi:hypothetical protein